MKTLAQWCFRHRSIVIVAWLVLLIALIVGGKAAGGSAYADAFSLPGTDSTKALDLLEKSVPSVSGDSDTIVWKVSSGSPRCSPRSRRFLTS
jgi:RND superfamily putative drug exporter